MSALSVLLLSCGISYRQFDHWCTKGYVLDLHDDQHPGQGNPRPLTNRQVRHLRVMGDLVKSGVRPDAATGLASQIIAGQTPRLGRYAIIPAHRIEKAS